jgi:hypothetical protein
MAVGHIFYHVLIAVHLQLNQTNPVNVLGNIFIGKSDA